jgi:hypothetical protein
MLICERVRHIAKIAAIGGLFAAPAYAQDPGYPHPQKEFSQPQFPSSNQSQLKSYLAGVRPKLAEPQWTLWGKVTSLEQCWGSDCVLVFLDSSSPSQVNPDGCQLLTIGFVSDDTRPDRGLIHTMVLSAFIGGKEVALLISGCSRGPPESAAPSILAVWIR